LINSGSRRLALRRGDHLHPIGVAMERGQAVELRRVRQLRAAMERLVAGEQGAEP
jgi:hypothetical protein